MTTTSKFHAGRLEFFDTATFEYMLPVAPIHFYEDFLGQSYVAVPAAGSAVDGCPFVKKIVGAGPPTLAGVANAIGGQVACTLGGDQRERGLRPVLGRQPRAGLHQGADLRDARSLLSVLPSAAGCAGGVGCGLGLDRRAAEQHLLPGIQRAGEWRGAGHCVRRGDDDLGCERCDGRHDRLAYLPDRRDQPDRCGVLHRRRTG